jgi:hypothetical protein
MLKPLVVAACLAALVACSPTIRLPRLGSPGTAPAQRATADVFDPYPQPDVGPEIVGGRPREYGIPRNEVVRSQDFLRSAGLRPPQELQAPIPMGPPTPIMTPLPTGPPPVAAPLPTTPPPTTPELRY